MTSEKSVTRTWLYANREDYTLWQSVETSFFENGLRAHSRYYNTVKKAKIAAYIVFFVCQYLILGSILVFIISFVALFVILWQIPIYIQNIYAESLRIDLAYELAIMRSVLCRVSKESIEVAEVHTSPWVNTRYLLVKR